ncbi:MAG: isocitrate lyase/phosphoenolpyruvate mutase family protein [Chloroflexi bacterium]|nr:isocitrate lyase/phosphoenolpyruvate mutase family protein [Chloroflexota bacterium]
MAKRAREFRELIKTKTPVIAAAAYDGLSARIIQHFGFDVVYLGDGAMSTHLGMREALFDMHDVIGEAARVAEVVNIPVMLDGATGYGDAVHVTRFIRMLEQYGVAGTTIDDAEYPRTVLAYRLDGKQKVTRLIPLEEHLDRIRAALRARQDPNFVIVGRTDAGLEPPERVIGGGFDEAVKRAKAMMEVGVDMVHFRSHTVENTERLLKAVPGMPIKTTLPHLPDGTPVPIIWAKEHGVTVLHASGITLPPAFRAVYDAVKRLKETGMFPPADREQGRLLHEILGEPELLEIEANTVKGKRELAG